MLGDVGIRSGQADAPVSHLGHRRPHLLAGQPPSALDRLGPDGQVGQIGAGTGFGEQLAPVEVAYQGCVDPSLAPSGVPAEMIAGSAQAPMPRWGR